MRPRAIVLLSGGLDSTTCLAWAQAHYECIALSFMYGQRSTTELDAARTLTTQAGVEHRVINIDLGSLGGSALTDTSIEIPEEEQDKERGRDNDGHRYPLYRNDTYAGEDSSAGRASAVRRRSI